MTRQHPLFIPLLLSTTFLVGIGWAFASGAPALGGTVLAVAPLAALARALVQSRRHDED